jgi:hypothetical protein
MVAATQQALGALERVALVVESGLEPEVLQAGARRLAMTLARALQLTLLCEHAQWMIDHGGDVLMQPQCGLRSSRSTVTMDGSRSLLLG